jgi:hypothetical protein
VTNLEDSLLSGEYRVAMGVIVLVHLSLRSKFPQLMIQEPNASIVSVADASVSRQSEGVPCHSMILPSGGRHIYREALTY